MKPLSVSCFLLLLKGLERQLGAQNHSKLFQNNINVRREETHLFKTFSGLRLGCNAFILAKRLENKVNWMIQNQRHFECEILQELFEAKGQRLGSDVTNRQATKRGIWVCIHRQPTWKNFQFKSPGMKLLSVVGPLFISPLLFHLSRALLGVWHFGLFNCIYSSFHNRLDLIREPAFYVVFYFIFPI